jgi:hypothetical protein
VARVHVAVADLLFGSRVQSMVTGAGHELVADIGDADIVVIDLTSDADRGIARAADAPQAARTLGFFAHVEPDVRDRALAAGFDQVVPRSRFNREGGELVSRLAAAGPRERRR